MPPHEKSSSRRGVAWIAGGSAVGQGSALVALPVLSRLYDPDAFGLFSAAVAVCAIVGVAAAGRFDMAVAVPPDDDDAIGLVVLGTYVAAAVGLLAFVVATAWHLFAPKLYGGENGLVFLIPIIVATYGVYLCFNQLAVRQHRFAPVGVRNALNGTVTVGSQACFGAFGAVRDIGLLAGYLLGQLIATMSLTRGSGLTLANWRTHTNPSRMRRLFQRFRRFPFTLAPAGLMNASGAYLPIILVAISYGSADAGQWGMAQRILLAPVALIGAAVSQVFISRFSEQMRNGNGDLEGIFFAATRKLLWIAVLLGVAVLSLSGPAIPLVLGEDWTKTAAVMVALSPFAAAQLVGASLSPVLVVLERTTAVVIWDASRVVLVTGCLVLVQTRDGAMVTAAWALSGLAVALYTAQWLLSWHAVRTHSEGPP